MIPLGQLITGLIKLGRPGCAGNKATLPHTIQPCFGAKEGHLMMCFPTSELPHTPTRLTHTQSLFLGKMELLELLAGIQLGWPSKEQIHTFN